MKILITLAATLCLAQAIVGQIAWHPAGEIPTNYQPLHFEKAANGDIFLLCRYVQNAVTNARLLKSTDEGVSWSEVQMTGLPPLDPTGFLITPNKMLVCGTPDMVYASSDGGSTWVSSNTGVVNTYSLSGLAAMPNGDLVLGSTYPVGGGYRHLLLFTSADGGLSWQGPYSNTLLWYTKLTAITYAAEQLLLAAYSFTPPPPNYYSISGVPGNTWTPAQGLAPRFRTNDFAVLTSGEIFAVGEVRTTSDQPAGVGIYSSTNGTSWQPVSFTGADSLFTATTILQTSTGLLLAGTGISDSYVYLGSSTAGIAEERAVNNILYPNPAKDCFFVNRSKINNLKSIEVYDLSGRLAKSFSDMHDCLSLEGLPAGMYFVRLKTDRNYSMEKLIRE